VHLGCWEAMEAPFPAALGPLCGEDDQPAGNDGVTERRIISIGKTTSESTSAGNTPRSLSSASESDGFEAQPLCIETNSYGQADYEYPAAISTPNSPGLPEFDYPFPLIVKNTFLDIGAKGPSSLDGFFEDRKISSCISRIRALPSVLKEDDNDVDEHMELFDAGIQQQPPSLPIIPSPPAQPPVFTPGTKQFGAFRQYPQAPSPGFGEVYERPILELPGLPLRAPQQAQVLWFADPLPQLEPSLSELPSVGSATHHLGTCRPCAHAHKPKGCKNGVQCSFCHLCPPGELKRRQWAKKYHSL